uniref:Uncharacterized protein n=1 Tax=Cucumis sativus TaxID=3659 RepID=A0A0A0LYB0_CUCSA
MRSTISSSPSRYLSTSAHEGKPRSPSSSARDKTSSSFSMSCAASPFQAPPPLFPAAAGLLPRFPSDRTPVAFPLQAARDSFFSPSRV